MRREGGKNRDMWELQAAEEEEKAHTSLNPLSALMHMAGMTSDGGATSEEESVKSVLALRTRV